MTYQPISYRNHYKELITLGFPIVVGQIGLIVLGFADTLMIGHHSADELSAAGFVNNLFNLFIIFGLGFSYGLTPVVGALYGKGQLADIGQKLKNSLMANLLVSLLMVAVIGGIYLRLEWLGQPDELLPYIRPYYLILLASIPFVMLFNAFKQFADGITDTRLAMWILLGGNVLNIVGNYLLIYGVAGLPELGIVGAGLSTLLSRIVMLAVFVGYVFRHRRYAVYRKGFLRSSLNWADLRLFNKLGWPIALQMGMETAAFSLSAVMLGWIGAAALGAHQIMVTIGGTYFMVYYGIGAAVTIRVSHFSGQHDTANLRRAAFSGYHINIVLCLLACLSLVVFRGQLGGWFTDSADINAIVLTLVVPMMVYQFGDATQITFANALRGIADVKYMMYFAFIAYILIELPAGYLFGFTLHGGAVGVWMGLPLGLTSAGLLFLFRFLRQTREK